MLISLFPTPFDHFHPTLGLDPALILTLRHNTIHLLQNLNITVLQYDRLSLTVLPPALMVFLHRILLTTVVSVFVYWLVWLLYVQSFASSRKTRDTRVPWNHSRKPYWSEPLLETSGDQAKCDGNRNGGNRLVGAFSSEWHKLWSRLTAQICHFLWLITRNQDFFDKKCCILMFCDKKCRILTFCYKIAIF